MGKKYQRQRAKFTQAYFDYIRLKNFDNYEQEFFSSNNIRQFIMNQELFNTNLALVHSNKMVNDLQKTDDVRCNNVSINLLDRFEFKSLAPVKVKYKAINRLQIISNDQIRRFIQMHHNGESFLGCLLYFQMMSGLRVRNCMLHLDNNTYIDSRHMHEPDQFCDLENIECCRRIKLRTKTADNEIVTILPNIYRCSERIRQHKPQMTDSSLLKVYNMYIKRIFGPQYTSHDIRRILPNFMELKSTRNTGLWRSDVTMKRFYVAGFTLQRQLYLFIQDLKIDNKSNCLLGNY